MKVKKLLLLAMLICAIMCLQGCKKETGQQIRIGYFPNITHPQALVMKSQNTLEMALAGEMEVKWTAFNAGPSEVEAIFAGDIDIGYIGPVPAINANVKSKGDVSILAGVTSAGAILVKNESADISSVKDLDGKKVAVPQFGNTQHLCLLALLKETGLKPVSEGGTVDVVAVSNADVGNLMQQKTIDAALVPEPWGATLLEKGAVMVLDEKEVFMDGDYNVAVVIVRNDFLKENPEAVKAFLKAHEEASDYIVSNEEAAVRIMNEEIYNATQKKLDEAILTEGFGRIKVDTTVNRKALDEFVALGVEQQFISERPGDGIIVEVK